MSKRAQDPNVMHFDPNNEVFTKKESTDKGFIFNLYLVDQIINQLFIK